MALAVASGLANASFLAQPFVGSDLGLGSSLVSELSAAGQPAAGWFQAADIVQALFGLALVVPLALRWRTPRWLRATLVLAPLLSALGTLIQALVPEPCAPSLDPTCHPNTGFADMVGHGATSVIAAAAAIGSMAGLWWMHRRPHVAMPWLPPRAGRLWAALALVMGVFVAGTGLTEIAWSLFPIEVPALGEMQRVQLLCLSGWTIWLGWLATDPSRAGGDPPGPRG